MGLHLIHNDLPNGFMENEIFESGTSGFTACFLNLYSIIALISSLSSQPLIQPAATIFRLWEGESTSTCFSHSPWTLCDHPSFNFFADSSALTCQIFLLTSPLWLFYFFHYPSPNPSCLLIHNLFFFYFVQFHVQIINFNGNKTRKIIIDLVQHFC